MYSDFNSWYAILPVFSIHEQSKLRNSINLDVLHHSGELHRLVLSLHGSRVQAITTIHELHNVPLRVAHSEVVL